MYAGALLITYRDNASAAKWPRRRLEKCGRDLLRVFALSSLWLVDALAEQRMD